MLENRQPSKGKTKAKRKVNVWKVSLGWKEAVVLNPE